MSYISVVFLAASYQTLSQRWSFFKQNFPWKPTWGGCLGLSSCCVAPLWVPSNRLKRKPKMRSVQKNTKAECKAAPTHDLPPELWWSFHWEAPLKPEQLHLCCYSEKKIPKCNFGKVYRRTLARSVMTHTGNFCGYSHESKHVPTQRVAKWRQHLATWKVFFRLDNIHL